MYEQVLRVGGLGKLQTQKSLQWTETAAFSTRGPEFFESTTTSYITLFTSFASYAPNLTPYLSCSLRNSGQQVLAPTYTCNPANAPSQPKPFSKHMVLT